VSLLLVSVDRMPLLEPDLEATFLAGEHGRDGSLLLWGPGVTATNCHQVVEMAVPAGSQIRGKAVPATIGELRDLIDPLATLPASAPVTASVRAWSAATKVALDLIARGRVLPAIGSDDADTWRLGPLDPADLVLIESLVGALPAAAHAVNEPGTNPRRIADPALTVRAFLDAVADTFLRTASAVTATGFEAFAAPDIESSVDVADQRAWLRSAVAGAGGNALAHLRVDLPDDPEAVIEAVIEVQSAVDPGLILAASDLWDADPSVLARFGDEVDTDLLVTLRRASRAWAPLTRLLDQARPDRIELDDLEVDQLFGPVADDLAAAGLPVLWPAEVFRPIDLRPVVSTPFVDEPGERSGELTLSALGELRWRAAVDGEELTDAELTALAEAKRPMVRMRGRWIRADPNRLSRLRERTSIATGNVVAAALTGTLVIDGEEIDAEIDQPLLDIADRLATFTTDRSQDEPEGLLAELRPYQKRGLAWLNEMAALGLGGVLADDMGLGKTVQMLALHLARRPLPAAGPMLVVCPATLMSNWEREAARFCPGVPVRRHHGTGRDLGEVGADEIIVTTYGVARRDADTLDEVRWDLVVADEAQAVKNPESRTARALRRIGAQARFALTGTPVENRLTDLWALLDWTTPGLLGSLSSFRQHVAIPIEREQDEAVTKRLSMIVRPFLLRRRKSDPDIVPDLPPKTETDVFVGLTAEQATLYKAVVAELLTDVAEAEGIGRRGLVLKLLTALKQICNHPAQYLGQDEPIEGRSGKLAAVSDLVQVITDEDDSVLVFTQYVVMGRLLEAQFTRMGIAAQFLHGSLPVGKRQEMVDSFQAGEPRVFVISLKAGGSGLNLTQATHVIHYDRWWNPAVEDQASDRAWRIGQDRPVQVHRLICEGTLEERIAVILESKRALAESVVGGGEAWVSELTDDELADLVALAVEG